jgi:DNA-binding transcriptional ArsR family regulator
MVKCQRSELDDIFGALADPSRRFMVLSLRSGRATVEELGRPLGISTPAAMKHVAVLERSGLVVSEKLGRKRYCRLQADRLATAEEWMAEVRTFWSGTLNRLATHLENEEEEE